MQIAKMFATLGFNVDLTGLNQFKDALKGARADTALLSRNARVLKNNLDSVNKTLVSLNGNLRLKKTDSKISGTYVELKNAVVNADKALTSISKNQPYTTKALGKIHGSIIFGESKWKRYADEVQRTKELLKDVKGKMVELRQNSTVSLRVNGSGGGSSAFGNTGKNSGFLGGMMMGGMGNARNPLSFFRSILPATLLAGSIPAAGFVAKEIVTRGRDQQQMERALQFATKDTEQFGDSLKFVREEALRLGVSSATLGKTFGTVVGAADGKMELPQIKKLFTNMNEYFTAVHAGDYEKGLMNLAVQQMFSIGKIQGQEIGQLTGTGLITRAQLNQAIREVYGLKDNSQIEKMQVAGKLEPHKVLDQLFKNLAGRAHSTGAFDAAMQSSVTKQGQLNERFNQLSIKIMEVGLDKALANLFEGLSNLIDALERLGKTAQKVSGYISSFINSLSSLNGNSWMVVGAIAAVIGMFTKKKKSIFDTGKEVGKYQKGVERLTKFLDTRFGQAAIRMVGKLGFIGAGLVALFKLGSSLMEEANWLDFLAVDLQIISERFKNMFLRVKFGLDEMFGDTRLYQALKLTNTVQSAVSGTARNLIMGTQPTPQGGAKYSLTEEGRKKFNEMKLGFGTPNLLHSTREYIASLAQGGSYVPENQRKVITVNILQNGKVIGQETIDFRTAENYYIQGELKP